jgi:hypothetical protein
MRKRRPDSMSGCAARRRTIKTNGLCLSYKNFLCLLTKREDQDIYRTPKSKYSKMGSNAQEIQILSRNKQLLPETAIQEVKGAVQGEVLIRGEAPDEVYRAAIDRWNKAWVQEAVCHLPPKHAMLSVWKGY